MKETILTIEEAARCLPALVERIHADGNEAILLKSGRPVARIVAVPNGAHGTDDLIAFLRRWRQKYPEPDEQFGEAIEESRKKLSVAQQTAGMIPWDGDVKTLERIAEDREFGIIA